LSRLNELFLKDSLLRFTSDDDGTVNM